MVIPLAEPTLDGNEARYLAECVRTGYVSSVGPFVDRFERAFADVVGVRHAVGCASGTAALHVALRLAGARPGALVAVSDLTFIASANAATYTGAKLLLVDSELETWNMNTELLHDDVVRRARRGQQLPQIVEVVHVLGHPANIEPLLDLRSRFGIDIVEDAAEALGASWTRGYVATRQAGAIGRFGCYSFNGNKIITSGGGGMIVTDDPRLAAEAKHLTTQAKVGGTHYLHDSVGYNYRLTNVAAALGLAQLERLPHRLSAKHLIARRYGEQLRDLPLTLAPRARWAKPSHWLYSVLLENDALHPGEVVTAMNNAGIELRGLWPPLHLQPPYVTAERLGGEVAETIYRRGLSLPSSAHLSAENQQRVSAAIAAFLTQRPHSDATTATIIREP